MNLFLASTISLLALGGMLFGVIFATAVYATEQPLDIWLTLGIIILFNLLLWLWGPWWMDLLQRITYKIRKIELEELEAQNPKCAQIIRQVTEKYRFRTPKLRLIEDLNPTAYTYGSDRKNARIVISQGLLHYLDDDEAATVIAHELGHIVRYDFIIMSIASTLLQCLYVIYRKLASDRRRSSGSNNKSQNQLAMIGLAAFLCYYIGQYIVLYLSRAREYGADEFAVRETGNPNGLSSSLIKIAYGIAIESKKPGDKQLIKGTQTLGISNLKNADQISSLTQSEDEGQFSLPSQSILGRVLAFDFVSVWAQLSEFLSTHPLTGKRIRRINTFCGEFSQTPIISFEQVQQDIHAHKAEARVAFIRDFVVWLIPALGLGACVTGIILGQYLTALLGALVFIAGGFFKIAYKYPRIRKDLPVTDYLGLMQNFQASPVRGIPSLIEGKAAGKGVAGSYFSEDILIHTKNGIVLGNFQSMIPILGNLIAAFGKMKKLVASNVSIKTTGWFFRSNTRRIDLAKVTPDASLMKPFRSHPILGSFIWHLILSVIVGVVAFGTPEIHQELFSEKPQRQVRQITDEDLRKAEEDAIKRMEDFVKEMEQRNQN